MCRAAPDGGVPASGLQGRADPWFQMIHQGMAAGYNPKMKSWYPYNLAKAKKLLKESGYGKGFKLTMISPRNTIPADVQMCEAVVNMVKKIGIDANCQASSKRVWRGRFKKYAKGTLKGNMMFIASYGNQGGIPGNGRAMSVGRELPCHLKHGSFVGVFVRHRCLV